MPGAPPLCLHWAAGVALAIASVAAQLSFIAAFCDSVFFSSTALQAAIVGQASQLGSAGFARYVTAADIGAVAGPLLAWLSLERFDSPTIGLMLGAACFVLVAPVAARRRANEARHES